jgi:hypothetical protein
MAIAAVVSVAMQAYAGHRQAQAQKAAGEAQSNYYDYLAESSRRQGDAELQKGQMQSEIIQDAAKEKGKLLKTRGAEVAASQKVALAASGVPLSSVTAEDISRSTQGKITADALMLRHNADLKGWQAMTDAGYKKWEADTKAGQYGYASKYSAYAGRVNARNTYLGTAAKIGSNLLMSNVFSGFGSSGVTPRTNNLSGGGW